MVPWKWIELNFFIVAATVAHKHTLIQSSSSSHSMSSFLYAPRFSMREFLLEFFTHLFETKCFCFAVYACVNTCSISMMCLLNFVNSFSRCNVCHKCLLLLCDGWMMILLVLCGLSLLTTMFYSLFAHLNGNRWFKHRKLKKLAVLFRWLCAIWYIDKPFQSVKQ